MRQPKPLRAGDMIRLVSPGYGEPTGDCVVIADQSGAMVWFRASDQPSQYRGPCFVARRSAVRVIRRSSTNALDPPAPDQREYGPDDT
jgi:hypothetical protein